MVRGKRTMKIEKNKHDEETRKMEKLWNEINKEQKKMETVSKETRRKINEELYGDMQAEICRNISDYTDVIVLDTLNELCSVCTQLKQDYSDYISENICTLDEYNGVAKALGVVKKFVIEKMKEFE